MKVYNIGKDPSTMDTDADFLKDAYRFAAECSTDMSIQNAAIIVKDGKIIAQGATTFPKGVRETEKRWRRPEKYHYTVHAEQQALMDAVRRGISTKDATMYCPWCACTDCAKLIIEAGIVRLVGHKLVCDEYLERNGNEDRRKHWKQIIEKANEMFSEAGVQVVYLTPSIPGVQIMVGNKPYKPVKNTYAA